jgi:ABC-type amino acid transport substrate-binding protein
LWEKIAEEMGVEYELDIVVTIENLLAAVAHGEADLAIAGICLTSEREKYLDFSHPFFQSGLQIMISSEYDSPCRLFCPKFFRSSFPAA